MTIFNDGRTKNSSKLRFVVVIQVYTLSEQTDTTAKFQTAAESPGYDFQTKQYKVQKRTADFPKMWKMYSQKRRL